MDGFNFIIPYTVRVVDVNYGAHVANSAVLNFFQDARIAYLKSLGDYSEMDIGKGCGIILPEAHVKYLAEMFLGDELVIGARITNVSRSSFTMCYRIERDGEATAEGETVLICFDYEKRKPRRLDAVFIKKVAAFET
ncbi:MAG: acyl-CoA thioesterase [Desulfuromonadales bacterium]|jgi:YbgC/YbaW family acyl-CoA thioester hydrolase|nr:acyl-CoA thioesterase [Desulfuromonadales bacterium]